MRNSHPVLDHGTVKAAANITNKYLLYRGSLSELNIPFSHCPCNVESSNLHIMSAKTCISYTKVYCSTHISHPTRDAQEIPVSHVTKEVQKEEKHITCVFYHL